MALEKIGDQFKGLDMGALIGGPLNAACDSQMRLAKSTADFIQQIGFYTDGGVSKTRVADFSFSRSVVTGKDELGHDVYESEDIKLSVPMLAIVNVPSLMIDTVDITFDMEVSASESYKDSSDKEGTTSVSAKVGWSPFSASVSISGKVATHSENTRKSDNSAKYHVAVHASQSGTPEGLSRVLDIIATAVAPAAVESPQARKDKQIMKQLEPLARKKKALTLENDKMKLEVAQKSKELELIKKDEEKAKNITDVQPIDKLRSEAEAKIDTDLNA